MKVLDLTNLTKDEILILNEVAEEIREPFNTFVDFLANGQEHNIDWIVSVLASRNIYISTLFFNCCRLGLIKRIIERGEMPDSIVTDSIAMKRVLDDYFSQNNILVNVYCSLSIFGRLKERIVPLLRWVYWLYQSIYQYCFWNRLIHINYEFTNPIKLLDMFVLDNNFKDNDYIDRYYPGIWDYVSEEERKDFYYLPTCYQIQNLNRVGIEIKNSNQQFLIKEHFLRIQDYWFALCHPYRLLKYNFNVNYFLGFKMDYLVAEDILLNSCNYSSILAILNYLFVKRLKEEGIKVTLMIDWYENQVNDRGLDVGFRKFYPDTWIVGYQGFIAPPLIHMKPSLLEYNSEQIPHEIMVVGKGLVQPVREFCPELNVTVAPALRFKNVWRERIYFPENNTYTILVSLPIGLIEGNEILNLVFSAIYNKPLLNIRILIKPHPTNSPTIVKRHYGKDWPDRLEIASGNFSECIERSDLLISNTSSTCMETLAKGIPVIIIGSQSGLTQNPIPRNIEDDIWTLCYTEEELLQAILFYMDRDEEAIKRHEQTGRKIREMFFEPVTREGVRGFLNLED